MDKFTVQAYRSHDTLHLRVTDNGPGLCESNGTRGRAGVGLSNTRARLAELYGTAQQLDLKKAERAGCSLKFMIPFRASDTRERHRPHMKIRTLVADDEPLGRSLVRQLLAAGP